MISVCMATRNGAKYIQQQLASILSQLGPGDEVIVSDDRSTDGTRQIIESFHDPRIRLLDHTYTGKKHHTARTHQFIKNNFENAMQHAHGDIIFLSDQDDIWHPDRVRRMTDELRDCDFVMANRSNIDRNGRPIKGRVYSPDYMDRNLLKKMIYNGYPGCHVAFRRCVLEDALPIPEGVCLHDTWIGRLAVLRGRRMKFIDEPLLFYRTHGENVSNTAVGNAHNSIWFKVAYRARMMYHLAMRIVRLKFRK